MFREIAATFKPSKTKLGAGQENFSQSIPAGAQLWGLADPVQSLRLVSSTANDLKMQFLSPLPAAGDDHKLDGQNCQCIFTSFF